MPVVIHGRRCCGFCTWTRCFKSLHLYILRSLDWEMLARVTSVKSEVLQLGQARQLNGRTSGLMGITVCRVTIFSSKRLDF